MKNEILEKAKFKIEDLANIEDPIYFTMLDLLTDNTPRKQEILNRIGNNMPIYEYTGFNDKNGLELYRGDLVRINDGRVFFIVKEGLSWKMQQPQSKYTSFIFTDNKSKAYVEKIIISTEDDSYYFVECIDENGHDETVKEYAKNEFSSTADAINAFVEEFCNTKHSKSHGSFFRLMCYDGNEAGGVLSEIINTNQFN